MLTSRRPTGINKNRSCKDFMGNSSHFKPGQTIICREFWQNDKWSERPEIVAQDTPELLALYLPPNTIIKQPVSPIGDKATYLDRLNLTWSLVEAGWIGLRRLRL